MELRQKQWVPFIVLVLAMPLAIADVLVESIPPTATPTRVLAVVQSAFVGRQWTVENVDSDSVTARLNHNRVFVRMKVTLSGGQLLYETQTRRRTQAPSNPAQPTSGVNAADPDRWVRAIRKDIERLLPLSAS